MTTALVCVAIACWLVWGGRARVVLRPSSRRFAAVVDQRAARLLEHIFGKGPAEDPVAMCSALASELRAGAPPDAALLAVSEGSRLIRQGRAAATLGEPIGPALAADAARAGADPVAGGAIRGLAACWMVAADSGAGLADGVDRVAALAAAQQRVGADLQAEVAAPRATARILGLLPLFGLILGELLGARPVAWLLTSPIGWCCLALGAGFLLIGRFWAARIVAAAMPGRAAGAR